MADTTRPRVETTPASQILGRRVGRYLLLDSVGRGGCGEVYRAFDPALDRKIAIKVLHHQGVSDTEILHEGRLLARFSHPNVLPIFDVGIEQERVFLAMEYVDGGDLRGWIDNAAPADAVVALAGAARGLAAAHEAGIVHGDVKPANVLCADGRLLLSDFGIARAATIRAVGPTEPEQAGTPAFMAPELSREPASAASDQYAFCKMATAVLEGARVPGHVSAALRRGSDPESDQRWPSMTALADALGHRSGSRAPWVAGLAAVALVGGLGVANAARTDACSTAADSVAQRWNQDARAEVRLAITGSEAPEASRTWERVDAGLDDYVQAARGMRTGVCHAATQHGPDDETVRQRERCLDRAEFHLGAVVRALQTPTDNVDRLIDGLPQLEDCVSPSEAAPPEAVSQEVADVDDLVTEFSVMINAGRYPDAAQLYDALRDRAEATGHPPLMARAALAGASIAMLTDRDDEAVPLLERALASSIEHGLDRSARKAATKLGVLLADRLGRREEGLVYARLGVQYATRLKSSPGQEADARTSLGATLAAIGDTEGALAQTERALELSVEAYGPVDRRVALIHADLSIDLRRSGQLQAAEEHSREALRMRVAIFGEAHPATLRSRTNLAALLPLRDKAAEGEREARTVIALRDASATSTTYDRIMASMALAHALLKQDRFGEAIAEYRVVLALIDDSRGRHKSVQGLVLRNLAAALGNDGQTEESELVYARAVQHMESSLPAAHPRLAGLRISRAANFVELGELAKARAQADLALAALETAEGVSGSELSEAACAVGTIAHKQGEASVALTQLQRCVELRRDIGGEALALAQAALATATTGD